MAWSTFSHAHMASFAARRHIRTKGPREEFLIELVVRKILSRLTRFERSRCSLRCRDGTFCPTKKGHTDACPRSVRSSTYLSRLPLCMVMGKVARCPSGFPFFLLLPFWQPLPEYTPHPPLDIRKKYKIGVSVYSFSLPRLVARLFRGQVSRASLDRGTRDTWRIVRGGRGHDRN